MHLCITPNIRRSLFKTIPMKYLKALEFLNRINSDDEIYLIPDFVVLIKEEIGNCKADKIYIDQLQQILNLLNGRFAINGTNKTTQANSELFQKAIYKTINKLTDRNLEDTVPQSVP